MTTTDYSAPPSPPPADPPPTRVIRRSSTDRVAAGVAGGLGEYFRVDPVLFRVLFAVSAFFGGAGIVAYLLAWAVVPDANTSDAPLDRFIRELRRRHIPFWLVAAITVVVGWALLFSWWAPWPFAPVIIAVIVLVVVLSRRSSTPTPAPAAAPSMFEKSTEAPVTTASAGWVPETQAWISESRERSRIRRRRAAPVRWATLGTLAVTMAALIVADAVSGIVIPAYLWSFGGIVLAGLLMGLVLRRTPWTLSLLLVPTLVALIGLGGTRASLHDGSGRHFWTPASASQLDSSYRMAFGQGILDLRNVELDQAKHVNVTMAAGQVRILIPKGLNVQVHANVRFGSVELDGGTEFPPGHSGATGAGVDIDIPSSNGASGPALSINVHLADGDVSIENI